MSFANIQEAHSVPALSFQKNKGVLKNYSFENACSQKSFSSPDQPLRMAPKGKGTKGKKSAQGSDEEAVSVKERMESVSIVDNGKPIMSQASYPNHFQDEAPPMHEGIPWHFDSIANSSICCQ
jgi:hypothetical protein